MGELASPPPPRYLTELVRRGAGTQSWCFRVRLRLGVTVRLNVERPEWVLTSPEESEEGHLQ